MKKHVVFFSILTIAIIGLVIFSTILSRLQHDDKIKSSDINTIKTSIDDYVYKNNRLPDSLDAIDLKCSKEYKSNRPEIFNSSTTVDDCIPDRISNYRYKKVSTTDLSLCTEFATNTAGRTSPNNYESKGGFNYVDTSIHSSGDYCFNYVITLQSSSSINNYNKGYDVSPDIVTD